MKDKIVVLIPALNPGNEFTKYARELTSNNVYLIVVDDGSSDEYKYIFDEIKKCKNTTVLTHTTNKGKGRGLKTGFDYYLNNINSNDSAGIITADSDGQHTIKDVLDIGRELSKLDKPSLILGTRDFNLKQVPFKSRNGNKITTFVFKILYGKKINDTQTGLRGISYDIIKDFASIEGERFEYEINMLIDAVRKRIPIIEHKIETVYINNNSESHFRPFKDSFKIYKVMFKQLFKK